MLQQFPRGGPQVAREISILSYGSGVEIFVEGLVLGILGIGSDILFGSLGISSSLLRAEHCYRRVYHQWVRYLLLRVRWC